MRNKHFLCSLQYCSKLSWQSSLETRFLILKVFENQVLRLEFWRLRIEDQGSSFKTLDEFLRGSQTEILRKGFNSRKQNNSDEQNNCCMASFFCANSLWMYANTFSCCAFSTRHMRLTYLHWSLLLDDSKLMFYPYAFIVLPAGASVLFSFVWLQPAAKM